LCPDLLFPDQREREKSLRVQIFPVHVDRCDLAVFVGRIAVDSPSGIAAGGINRDLWPDANKHAAAHMRDALQNMEKLRDAFLVRVAASGMRVHKRRTHKSGGGGKVAGKTERAHAAAVWRQVQRRRKAVLWIAAAQRHVIAQIGHVIIKRRAVGEHADGVVVNLQAFFHRLKHDALAGIADEKMQRRERQFPIERNRSEVHARQKRARLRYAGALSEQPGNQLVGRDVIPPLGFRHVMGIAGEIQCSDRQSGFVGCIVIEWIAVHDRRHADHRQMGAQRRYAFEMKRKAARRNDDRFAKGTVQIEIPAEVMILRFEAERCAHDKKPPAAVVHAVCPAADTDMLFRLTLWRILRFRPCHNPFSWVQ